jgi:two-component system, NtrC family, sensor histidine kinase HydH
LSGWSRNLDATGTRRYLPFLLLVAVGVLASNVHWTAPMRSSGWAHVLWSLVFIPIVAVGVRQGALVATLIAVPSGLLHVLLPTLGQACSWIQVIGETSLAACLGWIAAAFSRSLSAQDLSHDPRATTLLDSVSREVPESWPTSVLTRVTVGLVHQFGTPVASIEGAAWMLDDANVSEEKKREFVGIIRKESQRLSRVLSEVLAFTRPRPPQFQQLDVSAVVDDVIHFACPKDRGPTILFEKAVPADLPHLRGDAEQIRQALLNLALNAVQATPPGGTVDISARVESNHFVITVVDHGQGIPESALGRIFDPFFTTRENSLGLGLPVAQHIIAEHGGRTTVESHLDNGTRVTIHLPVSPVRQT